MRVGDTVDFDPATGEVRRVDRLSRLEPQPSAVLALLASKPGQLIGHDEMRRAIWGDATHVNFQQSLHYCIREIRSALGDDARHSQFIETIPRRGYRLIAPIGATDRADEGLLAFLSPSSGATRNRSAPMPRQPWRRLACSKSLTRW
jgi:DNA-binding winged helix-turn-helix (wHTH) protein